MKTYIVLTVHNKRYKYFKEEAADPKTAMKQLSIRRSTESIIGCKELKLNDGEFGQRYETFFGGKYRIVPNTFVPFSAIYHNGEEEQ